MSVSRTAILVVAVGTALALGAPAATADEQPQSRLVLDDGTGDVWLESAGGEPTRASMPSADVVDAVAVHGRHRIRVTATFVDLRQVDPQDYGVELTTTRSAKPIFTFRVSTEPDNWDGRLQSGLDGGAGDSSCPGATHQVDYATETVSMMIPRSCVGRPDWVRVSIYNQLRHESVGEQPISYSDSPHDPDTEDLGRTHKLFRAPEAGNTGTAPVSEVELSDPTGDVWAYGPEVVLAPNTPTVDLIRAAITHRVHRLAIRLTFADLTAGGRQGYSARIRTDKGSHYARLDLSPKHPEGLFRLYGPSGRVDCAKARYQVDYDNDRVVMSIPRGCLGRPEWVRTMLYNSLIRRDDPSSNPELYTDNPHNDQPYPERATPRIYAETAS